MKKHIAVALSFVALMTGNVMAEQEERNDAKPPPELPPQVRERVLERIQDQVAPLSPEEIRFARQIINEMQQASNNRYENLEPKISTEVLNSRPGAEIPTLYAGVGFNTNVMFSDITGSPWPI